MVSIAGAKETSVHTEKKASITTGGRKRTTQSKNLHLHSQGKNKRKRNYLRVSHMKGKRAQEKDKGKSKEIGFGDKSNGIIGTDELLELGKELA